MAQLILKRAPIGPHQEEYDVLEDGAVVGRIFLMPIGLKGRPWMWTLAYGYHEDRTPMHCYEATARRRWRRSPRTGAGIAPPRRWRSDARLRLKMRRACGGNYC